MPSGRSLSEIGDIPLLIARAGRDEMPGLNACLDRFVSAALRANRDLTLVNHASGPHAFDVAEDSDASRRTVRAILGYLQSMLLPVPA